MPWATVLHLSWCPRSPGGIWWRCAPTFHGDLLVLNLRSAEGKRLALKPPPEGVAWVDQPPTSRDVAVSINLLAHLSLSADANQGMLTLGFDPILSNT